MTRQCRLKRENAASGSYSSNDNGESDSGSSSGRESRHSGSTASQAKNKIVASCHV